MMPESDREVLLDTRRHVSGTYPPNYPPLLPQMKGSLIIVLKNLMTPYFGKIVEIDLNQWPEKPTGPYVDADAEWGTFKVVARLKQGGGNKLVEGIGWNVCSMPAPQTGGSSITPDLHLCVYPYSGPGGFRKDDPLSGYIFNLSTRAMEKLKPPATPKLSAFLVPLKGDIYCFSDPSYLPDEADCLPERYSREKKSWELLKPFPHAGVVRGYAVIDDFILFNMRYKLLAYDCSSGNWHVVKRRCDFIGLGVVVGTTLYALTPGSYSIIALSITKGLSDDGVVVFSSCLLSRFNLFGPYHHELEMDDQTGGDHLVHFGDLNFCIVRTGYFNTDYSKQVLKIMHVQLHERENLVIFNHTMNFEIGHGEGFRICHCFSLPPDLDLVASKKEDERDDIDFAFDIQNVNPVGNGRRGRRRRRRRRRKGRRRRKNKSGKSESCGGDNGGEGSQSQMGSK